MPASNKHIYRPIEEHKRDRNNQEIYRDHPPLCKPWFRSQHGVDKDRNGKYIKNSHNDQQVAVEVEFLSFHGNVSFQTEMQPQNVALYGALMLLIEEEGGRWHLPSLDVMPLPVASVSSDKSVMQQGQRESRPRCQRSNQAQCGSTQ